MKPLADRGITSKIPVLRQRNREEKQGFVLAFRKTRVRLYVYVLLNASGIAKNNSLDCFCALLFKSSLSVVCFQGFVGTKCRNSGTSMLAYVSGAPAWRGRVQCHIVMAQVQSTKIPISPPRNKDREAGICSCSLRVKSAYLIE